MREKEGTCEFNFQTELLTRVNSVPPFDFFRVLEVSTVSEVREG